MDFECSDPRAIISLESNLLTNQIWFHWMISTAANSLLSSSNEALTLISLLLSSLSSYSGSSPVANGGSSFSCLPLSLFLFLLSHYLRIEVMHCIFRPRLLDFVLSLDDSLVKSASQKAFGSLPDISKAISELTVLKGVGPATASAVLAAFAPHITPFMSDEALEAALGNSKDYSLKQYLLFASKLQTKAKELSTEGDTFTPSDVERALWSCAVGKSQASQLNQDPKTNPSKTSKRKRKN